MKLVMKSYSTNGVLAGAVDGQNVFRKLLAACEKKPDSPTPLVLDFKAVELASASFLRESVFALKSHMRAKGAAWYPVLANVSATIEDELSILTESKKDALILCLCNEDGKISEPRLFGDLDPKHQRTFELVAECGEADAVALAQSFGASEQLQNATAWNNRLKTLCDRGVLMEFSKGRAKSYRPAW